MRLSPSLLSLLLLCAIAPMAGAVEPVKTDPALEAKVVEWRRDLHQHPELGNRETRTSALVAEHLRALGLDVKTGIATTGVAAVLKGGKPGPRIALRADMDALPVTERTSLPFASTATATFRGETVGVMHACGHDAHTSILMGVAEALAGMKDELPGEVLFIFQPAEEGPPDGEQGGAEEMLAQGLFTDFKPEAVFGLHVFSTLNAGQIGVRGGPLMAASDRFNIVVKGRQTHGSAPWGGIDPIVAAADVVGTAQTIVSRRQNISRQPVVVSFGAIKGGIRYNIIPDEVELVGTIRTFDEGMRQSVFAELKNVAEKVADAHGATAVAQVPDQKGNPATINDPALTARMRPSLEKAAGAGNVVDPGLTMGAEDFSLYAQQVPGMFFFVGATPKGQDPKTAPSNHSPEFFLDESALDVGLRALLQVSLDYLNGDVSG
ncbi:N-acyl-L-amino acid amidohydrolase [Pseudoxanthomonas kalamensis DSM 18571]|uniref:M20 family metallopeptidase n=1 Tax=Pseudoxanthomonas kalamensis TaxID=289483 RepID=UPI001391520D|nr:M20 family metallopeptidase [Pseudoxanthomonas kalamensis]KAF1712359.1 N-acyl-L-amino acid amidohydrolase [Pseudoxanthomonas kalamensis DSM 18571]